MLCLLGLCQVRANTSGRAMDVKACYTMREGFSMLDFEDPCIEVPPTRPPPLPAHAWPILLLQLCPVLG